MSSEESKPATLEPSKLGTQDYWETLYLREQANHAANPSDKGTVWFDDSNAQEKVLKFLHSRCSDQVIPFDHEEPDASSSDYDDSENEDDTEPPTTKDLSHTTTSFLDLGSGNGSLLLSLRKSGFAGPLHGIDYSPASVSFAQQLAASLPTNPSITFSHWDVLKSSYDTLLTGAQEQGFDVVLDKGTFDAISLSEEIDEHGRRVFERYPTRVLRLVKRGGLLVITSCNWTEEELKAWFVERRKGKEGSWEVAGRVKYRMFSFGGVTGQTISTMCFRRA